MNIRKTLLLAVLMAPLTLQAAEVSKEMAAATAKLIMADRVDGFEGEVQSVKTVYYEGQKAYHVVQFAPQGWMLISAEDQSSPLIGYSPDGVFPEEKDMPENMQSQMNWYSDQVVRNARLTGSRHHGWERLQVGEQGIEASRPAMARRYASANKVEPLITVKWNQTGSFQKYCPKTNDGQAVVGCVAVGMAQAMSVAKWPDRPVGNYGYTHEIYGSMYIDYDAEPDYNWSAILSGANGNDDVARLLYHCGVSVKMNYGVDGSGTQDAYIAGALVRNFKYPQSVKWYSRNGWSDEDWHDLIVTELQEGRAVAYSGSDPKKHYGHCFNLDGFDGSSAFHVNWGWGGVGNAYFQLNGLKDAKMDMNYTDGQSVVVGIRPPSEKPSNIYLSNNSIMAMKPAGSVVGDITVESEAENPTYEFKVVGEYNVIFHTNMPAPFQVVDGQLVTTKELSLEDGDRNIEITATNTQNKASVTRHFTIHVTTTDGINLVETTPTVIGEEIYSLSGMRMDAAGKGLSIVRQRMSDGSRRSYKRVRK
ncbi:MAG: C10 family peptidase [Prevotella sp.]|jgi:hypothetical protein|nr:C10 family peptidase [Prevotella sp.]